MLQAHAHDPEAPKPGAAVATPSEPARLAALRQLQVLDTFEEHAYDDLTRAAASLLQVPIALVSLVDEDRQWFKSRVGLQARQTPREFAFCAHAILRPEEIMVVTDARQDPRFRNNPLVEGEPGIRFYAGAPLVTAEGHAVGTLCAIDTRPRHFDPDRLEELRFLARQVMSLLELRRALAAPL